MTAGLLFLAPALLLLVALFAGRYPGERRLSEIAARGRRRGARRAPTQPTAARPRVPGVLVARGGALLARSLAKRPPPLMVHS